MTHGFDAPRDPHAPRSTVSPSAGPPGSVAARVAIVRHRDAPEGDHLDLFVGPFNRAHPPAPDDRVALSWRLPLDAWNEPTARARDGRHPAVATPAHRASYLSLDTPRTLDGGRGRVEPLFRGDGWLLPAADRIVAETGPYRLELHRSADGWIAELSTSHATGAPESA